VEPARFIVEIDREVDGRWIADVIDVPGAMAYGSTRDEAVKHAVAIAFRALADRLEAGEASPQEFRHLLELHEPQA